MLQLPRIVIALGIVGAVMRIAAAEPSLQLTSDPAAAPPSQADALADVRADNFGGERTERRVYLAWSGLSLAGGAALVAVASDRRMRALGGWLVAWGVLDTAIAIPGLLNEAHLSRQIQNDRGLRGEPLAISRDRAIAHETNQSRMFSVFVGLDVASIAAGSLLWHYGRGDVVQAFGIAGVIEGVGLAAYDMNGLVLSSRRDSRLAALRIAFSPGGASVGGSF
jgi:hypothetical protein